MSICPLCNRLKRPAFKCTCGSFMEDNGPVTDYYGPYSPYFNMEFESPVCHHLLTCPECGHDTVIGIKLEESP